MREVIIADKQDITKLGLRYILNTIKEGISVFEADEKSDLVTLLTEHPQSIVVLDYTTFDIGSANEMLILQSRFVETNWVLFSEELNDDLLRAVVFNSQAFSVVLKASEADEINAALSSALRGDRFICNRVTNQLLMSNRASQPKDEKLLTQTEKEILKEIAIGKTTKEIANDRNLSFHTIITHRKNIFRKLDVNNVHEATKYAMRAGIIDVSDYYI